MNIGKERASGTSIARGQFQFNLFVKQQLRFVCLQIDEENSKFHTKEMMSEHSKRFISVFLVLQAIFTLNDANQANNIEKLLFPQSFKDETAGRYHVMIEYIASLFCTHGTYRFNHIYVERSLSSGFADILINRINKCMTAGVLISR